MNQKVNKLKVVSSSNKELRRICGLKSPLHLQSLWAQHNLLSNTYGGEVARIRR